MPMSSRVFTKLFWVSMPKMIRISLGVEPSDDPQETVKLATALGNLTIVRKGPIDIISDGVTSKHSNIYCAFFLFTDSFNFV